MNETSTSSLGRNLWLGGGIVVALAVAARLVPV